MSNRLGPIRFFPACTEWQIAQVLLNTALPAAASAAWAGSANATKDRPTRMPAAHCLTLGIICIVPCFRLELLAPSDSFSFLFLTTIWTPTFNYCIVTANCATKHVMVVSMQASVNWRKLVRSHRELRNQAHHGGTDANQSEDDPHGGCRGHAADERSGYCRVRRHGGRCEGYAGARGCSGYCERAQRAGRVQQRRRRVQAGRPLCLLCAP